MNCPKCNGNNWVAEYMASVKQRVEVVGFNDAGELQLNYTDPAEIVQEEDGEDDQVRCRDCEYTVDLHTGFHYYDGDPPLPGYKEPTGPGPNAQHITPMTMADVLEQFKDGPFGRRI